MHFPEWIFQGKTCFNLSFLVNDVYLSFKKTYSLSSVLFISFLILLYFLICRPAIMLPGASKPVVAVRFCPVAFNLRGLASGISSLIDFY
jgi:hypothetical protein